MVKCEKCGFGHNPSNGRFCGLCGTKLSDGSKTPFSDTKWHKGVITKINSFGGRVLRNGRKKT